MESPNDLNTNYTDLKNSIVSSSKENELPFMFTKKQEKVYRADEWIYSDMGTYLRLEYYKGNSDHLVIPNEICNKLTKIKSIDDSVIPNIKSIKSITISCNDSGEKIELETSSLMYAFKNNYNLESVDLTGLDTARVTNMYGMFFGCSNLKIINLNGLDTRGVIDMRNMFANCTSLQSLDIKSLDMRNLKYADNMFFNNISLRLLRIDSFNSNVLDISKIFTYFFELYKTPLLLITNDKRLLKYKGFPGYPFNRVPFSTPIFDANGGLFDDGTDQKSYFDKVANITEKIQLPVFEQFKKDNIPNKIGYTFAGWEIISGKIKNRTNLNDMLDFRNAIYQAQWKPKLDQ